MVASGKMSWLKINTLLLMVPVTMLMVACGPKDVDVELPETLPDVKVTSYTQALADLGLMTEIYATGVAKIQSEDITDHTGASGASGGEIQRNITEIMKSTLNSIGGYVTFIEYDPSYIQNQMVTGYSNFDDKMIPDVVITGGITEFDRGLETRGEGLDVAAEADFTNAPSWAPSKKVGFDYSDSSKAGKARITLDFNMKDFKTLAGISRMNTVNSMEVHKAVRNQEVGITIFGPTFGAKGSIKKVQGRHEAVRLLVQASMIQMVGKYLMLPYWRLLGDDNDPDSIIVRSLTKRYYELNDEQRIYSIQEWLFLQGHDLSPSGVMDNATTAAIAQFRPDSAGRPVTEDLFLASYFAIPIDYAALNRRKQLDKMWEDAQAIQEQQYVEPAPQPQQQAVQEQAAPAPEPQQQAQQQEAAPAPQAKPAAPRGGGSSSAVPIGRMLTDDEW